MFINLYQELLDELENEEIPSYIREARLEALKKQTNDLQLMKEKQHGLYTLVQLSNNIHINIHVYCRFFFFVAPEK